MGKYSNTEEQVYSVFALAEWKAEDILTFPANYVGKDITKDYIRANIIPSGEGVNRISVSGLILIDIFVEAGKGTKALTDIADKLDLYLCNKSFKTSGPSVTQVFNSSLQLRGLDQDNPALYRGVYSIPFIYTEVPQ